jgi:ABC-type transport system involved in multi-copper enzyme maturation permease subunit
VNTALLVAFARQRLTSPIRLVFLAFLFLGPLALVAAAPAMGLNVLQDPSMFALLFGVGMVGQDVSSGVLQLLFARPVRRSDYALTRWIGASLLASGCVVLQAVIATLILLLREAPPETRLLFGVMASGVVEAVGVSAVLLLFSSLVPGVGDLGVFVLLKFFGQGANVAGQMMNRPWLASIGEEVDRTLTNGIAFPQVTGNAISWEHVAAWLATVALCLGLAILVLNRKELSYAQT